MSQHPRAALRNALADHLGDLQWFAGWPRIRAWDRALPPNFASAYVVATPSEQAEYTGRGQVFRDVPVVVGTKRAGNVSELEDILDEDSATVELAVMQFFEARHADFDVSEWAYEGLEIDINRDGEQPIGTMSMTFRARRFTPEGKPV